jgi:hypothetical protein
MPNIILCKHRLPTSECKICFKEYHREYMREYHKRPQAIKYTREYLQRPEVKDSRREYRHQYYQRPEVKQYHREYMKTYYQRPEVKGRIKESYKEYRIIQDLLKKYTIDLNNLNAQIKREWTIPPIPIQGKQIELQNLIDNLRIIKEYTASLPRTIRAQTRKKMLKKLLSTEGRLVSWRKPLPRGSDRNQNVNTSMKKE